ncbi:MAG TPA: class I tRNA ligase family protein, partial [bacterium]|nr:class I tRNA ligase family protein [bacterium]
NIKDWCISRQIWWGHRIPVWYCKDCSHFEVIEHKPKKPCPRCGSSNYYQENDVLDTWFSAALWPFVALGWPKDTATLKTFYPNSLMETGFDIIFFWVARMIMFGLEFMNEVPFKEVLYHAMIRDEKGQKMSKTKGNVIDPLVITEKYGTDTLRFTLASMAGRARDIKLSENSIQGYSHFMNKIWQASKFVYINADGLNKKCKIDELKYPLNKWIVSRLNSTAVLANKKFEVYELNDVCELLYKFFWHEFCDWYIELSKPLLNDDKASSETKYVLCYVHREFLKLLHPVAPFITEKLYQSSPLNDGETIMLSKYPEGNQNLVDETVETDFGFIQELVSSIRNIKIIYGINAKNDVIVVSKKHAALINDLKGPISKLATLRDLAVLDSVKADSFPDSIRVVFKDAEIYMPAKEFIDTEKELARFKKKLEEINKDLNIVNNKLSNAGFLEKAGVEVVEKEKKKQEEFLKLSKDVNEAIRTLESLKK